MELQINKLNEFHRNSTSSFKQSPESNPGKMASFNYIIIALVVIFSLFVIAEIQAQDDVSGSFGADIASDMASGNLDAVADLDPTNILSAFTGDGGDDDSSDEGSPSSSGFMQFFQSFLPGN